MIPRAVVERVRVHEGWSATVYTCPAGYPTIGYGTRINEIELDRETGERWLVAELEEKHARLVHVEGYAQLDEVRMGVILEMAYQMGVGACLRFRRMWAAIRRRDWLDASEEMLDSRWARDQAPTRAAVLAKLMAWGGEGA